MPIVIIVRPVRRSVFDVILYWDVVGIVGEEELEEFGVDAFGETGLIEFVRFEVFEGLEEVLSEVDGGRTGLEVELEVELLGGNGVATKMGLLIFKHFLESKFKMNPPMHSVQSFEPLSHLVQVSFFKR